ncbi:MAG: M14 family metallopeptidase [Solobacterium sp.]|jgi:murein tripeptide amidase MpaA|nr:M14 family metallopeptidase [Solobacterium sp.]MCH4265248.1 M14 family metallopeptidase [Solobacterium sp.]
MKTTYKYDHYWKYEELKQSLQNLQKSYPSLCSIETICVTEESRCLFAVTLTNTKTGSASSKPAFYIDANTHAGEVTGSMAALHAIDYLLTSYGIEESVTKLLDQETVYVIPRISPDGAEKYLTTPYILRSADRVYNEVKGGIKDEDLDQDGVIRMMRIPTPYGAWKKDGCSMILRQPDDMEGDYFDIFPEGYLEDYDGSENLKHAKPAWGLDFNRNYPFGWFPDSRQPGAGKYPLSNPENKAVVDFVLAHPNICGVSTNHTSGGVILYPPGTKAASSAPKHDIDTFIAIGNMAKKEMGYEPINIFDSFMDDQINYDSGAFDDWCYQTQGIPAFTVELWDLANRAGVPITWNMHRSEEPTTAMKRFNACMDWVKKNAPQYWLDWTPFHHPQFGDVELGGFNIKYTMQNPPENFLLQECEKMTKFMVRFAKTVPHLSIDSIACAKESAGIYQITATVGNLGYLPTCLSDEAVTLHVNHPVTVTLQGADPISGKTVETVGDLSGYSRTATDTHYYGNITTKYSAPAKKKLTWIVKANPGDTITVSAAQEKAGTAVSSITIK